MREDHSHILKNRAAPVAHHAHPPLLPHVRRRTWSQSTANGARSSRSVLPSLGTRPGPAPSGPLSGPAFSYRMKHRKMLIFLPGHCDPGSPKGATDFRLCARSCERANIAQRTVRARDGTAENGGGPRLEKPFLPDRRRTCRWKRATLDIAAILGERASRGAVASHTPRRDTRQTMNWWFSPPLTMGDYGHEELCIALRSA